ncbi:protein of unknown function [Granulicella rosea]|uniref:DUF4174 domain-containing protein n=1 Tax=Granulicella rosea TaxID=474952 RepID=A0A239MA55_9BACT|nr:DUF4174 domain-containing protein [Granulicella rosea]SNT39521.1 protein of unknown function [Granulicella rosea]
MRPSNPFPRLLLAVALTLPVAARPMPAQTTGVDSSKPFTLDSMKSYYRPILVFAPSATPDFIQQLKLLEGHGSEVTERDVVILPLPAKGGFFTGTHFNKAEAGHMTASEAAHAREQFHIEPTGLTVLLLGKDGEEKFRSQTPVTWDRLRELIDSMPMRQEEDKDRSKK